MRKTVFTLLLIVSAHYVFSQSFALNSPASYVTRGMATPLNIVSPDIHCDSIILKSKNGTIEKNKCSIIYTATDSVTANIQVYYKKNGKTIEAKNYSLPVKEIEKPNAKVGSKTGGTISKENMLASGNVMAMINVSYGRMEPTSVYSYYVVIFRNEKQLFGSVNYGGSFMPKTITAMNALQPGDIVIFANIKTGYNDRTIIANPVEYIIE
jgi:hypothetical protein